MKKIVFFALFGALVLGATTAQAQQSAKEVTEFAEAIDIGKYFDPAFDLGSYAYIPENVAGITAIDGDPSWHGGLIPAGSHTLSLSYEDFNFNSVRAVKMITELRQFNFEPGKAYRFARGENNELLIEEDPWNKMEYIRSFLSYPESNPDRLEGTWSGETRRAMTSYSMLCRITGDRMVFESKSGKREFAVEGAIYYNENTIILVPDKATANGKDAEDFGLKAKIGDLYHPDIALKYVWYYTLTDGMLHLESNRKPTVRGLMWENDGQLRRTNP